MLSQSPFLLNEFLGILSFLRPVLRSAAKDEKQESISHISLENWIPVFTGMTLFHSQQLHPAQQGIQTK